MERAREFHFVAQLPRTTVPEVDYADDVYDRQVLLNEPWYLYAARTGRANQAADIHDKFVTETWAEWEQRKRVQAATLDAYDREQHRLAELRRAKEKQRQQHGDDTVSYLIRLEEKRMSTNLPVMHTLLLDFDELRAQREARQRHDVEEEETRVRDALARERQAWLVDMKTQAHAELEVILSQLEQRRRERELEEARRREEENRRAEELKAELERKRREQEEEDRKRREATEEAKKAERRRKEEERRNKAKADRDAAKSGQSTVDVTSSQAMTSAPAGISASDDASGPDARIAARLASREKRIARMHHELGSVVQRLQAEAGSCASSEDAVALAGSIVSQFAHGAAFFHAAVYVGFVDPMLSAKTAPEDTSIHFRYASSNCSDALRAGLLSLRPKDHPTAPMVVSCLKERQATDVLNVAQHPGLIHLGTGEPLSATGATGEFVAIPVLSNDSHKSVLAVIACDTLSSNAQDPASSFRAGEEACYDGPSWLDASITPQMTSALVAAADSLGRALTTAMTNQAKSEKALHLSIGTPPHGAADWPSLGALWAALCHALRRGLPGCDCYVARVSRHGEGAAATIVCHNGIHAGSADPGSAAAESSLLGRSIDSAGSLTLSTYVHLTPATPSRVLVADTAVDAKCVPYRGTAAAKPSECLLLVPISEAAHSAAPQIGWVVGVSLTPAGSISDTMAAAIEAFIRGDVQPLVDRRLVQNVCAMHAEQACDWLSLCTGGANVYVSLLSTHSTAAAPVAPTAPLTMVAASDEQQWLVGKTWTKQADGGSSHDFLASVPPGSPPPTDPKEVFASRKAVTAWTGVKLWNDALKTPPNHSELLMAAIVSPGRLQPAPYGIVYVDNVHSNKKHPFEAPDDVMARTAAMILGILLDAAVHKAPLPSAEGTLTTPLSIEKAVGEDRIAFLKQLWIKAIHDLKGVTKNQLLELAGYNSPPPVIPHIVAATMIVQGTKPTTVKEWEDMRKHINQKLLDAMLAFDPSHATKPKAAFFLRARKMTKGMSAGDVFSRGSYPASCFFSWTFTAVLLRRTSDRMRKRLAAGKDIDEEAASSAPSSGGADEQDLGPDDDVEDENAATKPPSH